MKYSIWIGISINKEILKKSYLLYSIIYTYLWQNKTVTNQDSIFSFNFRYNSAIKYLLTVPKYRNKALQMAKDQGLLEKIKKTRGKSKTEVKEETDAIVRKVLEDNMDIR